MTIDKDDLDALKELLEKGTVFSNVMYEYMMSLNEAKLYGDVTDFLDKVNSIVYDLEREGEGKIEHEKYSSNNPFFEVLYGVMFLKSGLLNIPAP